MDRWQSVPVRLYRTQDRLVVAAAMPGLLPQDVTVDVTITGQLILAAIGDIQRFPDAHKLVGYAGLGASVARQLGTGALRRTHYRAWAPRFSAGRWSTWLGRSRKPRVLESVVRPPG
jgi:hypothetical protein